MASTPINFSLQARRLNITFLDPEVLREVLPHLNRQEREQLLYLWIIEGIPYAFREVPMLYGSLRKWIAWKFDIPEKDVTLVGSARTGFSLETFGRPFNPHSDLDLALVSESWFYKLRDNFEAWRADFEHEKILPQSNYERTVWVKNFEIVPKNIMRGFITAKLLANRKRYQSTQLMAGVMSELHRKLKQAEGAPSIREASVRVYRDWESLVKQNNLNLWTISKKLIT